MIVVICVDDKNGMMFNNRRQSQDRELRKTILEETKENKLWMNSYSYKQFKEDDSSNIIIDDKFLIKAELGDYCFVEDVDIRPYVDYIEKIILFRWNRNYPADFYFDVDMSEWKLVSTKEFVGNSHAKITEEIYENGGT